MTTGIGPEAAAGPGDSTFRTHVVLLLGGALLVLWGSAMAWLTWSQPDAITISRLQGDRSGAELRPLMRAMGFVALTAVPAVIALRGRGRRALGAVVGIASGLLVAYAAVDAMAYRRRPVLRDLAPNGGCLSARDVTCIADRHAPLLGPLLVLVGAALLLVAGLIAVRQGGGWTGLGSSYEAPGAAPEPPVTEKGVWDALDRGDDPTA